MIWFACQFLNHILFADFDLSIWAESYVVSLSALFELLDYLLCLFVFLLFNDLCKKIVNLLTLSYFPFLFFNDGLFHGDDILAIDKIIVDPNVQSIDAVFDGIIEVFDEFFLIKLIMGLKNLLALHCVDEVFGDFFKNFFVNVVFKELTKF
jgi:hypothetical protein